MNIEMTNEIEERKGETNGRKWTMRNQIGYMALEGEKYPRRVVITLADEAKPYPAGNYTFGSGTLQVGKFDKLELARTPVLVPAKIQVKAAS